MRTPGHDFELAVGFCFTDGLLAGAPVLRTRYCGTGSAVETEFNAVSVETGGQAPVPTPRLTATTSSCGLCGSATLDELVDRLDPLPAAEPFPPEVLLAVTDKAAVDQDLFAATGAVHAAAAFGRDGEPVPAPGGHRSSQRRGQGGRPAAPGRRPARPRTSACSSADGPPSRSCRRRGRLGSPPWSPSVPPPPSPSTPRRAAGLQLAGFARDGQINLYAPEDMA